MGSRVNKTAWNRGAGGHTTLLIKIWEEGHKGGWGQGGKQLCYLLQITKFTINITLGLKFGEYAHQETYGGIKHYLDPPPPSWLINRRKQEC
jgi:hypothetical protein